MAVARILRVSAHTKGSTVPLPVAGRPVKLREEIASRSPVAWRWKKGTTIIARTQASVSGAGFGASCAPEPVHPGQ